MSEVSTIKVYLAGAIDGVPPEYAEGWRRRATELLTQCGIETINPLDLDKPGSGGIIGRDLDAVTKADILLVEMDWPGHAYVGTAIEVFWARRALGGRAAAPVVIWGEAGRDSRFLSELGTERVGTARDGISRVVQLADELRGGGQRGDRIRRAAIAGTVKGESTCPV